jgi:hypothetical protein
MTEREKRTDEFGRAYKGSQLQVQVYVNRREAELSTAVRDALGLAGSAIIWVSPLEEHGFKELQDKRFLEAIGQWSAGMDLVEFWPANGPVWDALATVRVGGSGDGVLLVEGKSYPGEMRSDGCKATPASRKRIEAALERTRSWLGASDSTAWTAEYYQLANRFAHLYFFREVVRVPAWLVSLCFTDDPHCRTSADAWRSGLAEAREALGLTGRHIPHYAEVLLPARTRDELVDSMPGAG